MNLMLPIILLALVAVIASLLQARVQRKERQRIEREEGELWLALKDQEDSDWRWPKGKEL